MTTPPTPASSSSSSPSPSSKPTASHHHPNGPQPPSQQTTTTTTTWKEDHKSWENYQGLSVVERMTKIKAALQEGVAQFESPTVMGETVAALHETLPSELRASLPWSALTNLIDTGFRRIGWSFLGKDEEAESSSPQATAEARQTALKEALHGVTHWLPDAALDHSATPTVDPSTLGPELSFAEYKQMWPVTYPEAPILRVLDPDFPRRPYKARDEKKDKNNDDKETEEAEVEAEPTFIRDPHWGQRKLFMNELELLTLHGEPGDTVVYAGAAPGRHIAHLAEKFFPDIFFVLVDPAPFRIQATERILLVNGLMTDALAEEYAEKNREAGKDVIFVSDIRRTYASEDLILEDMMDQQRWHDIMQPKVSMFKFRLPWRAGLTEYVEGEVYTQPYAKPRSTETRLIVMKGAQRKQWDNRSYEEQCFFFNTVVRTHTHAHGVVGAALEETWDYAAEVEIWRRYKLKYDQTHTHTERETDTGTDTQTQRFVDMSREEQNKVIARMSVELTEQLEGAQGREWMGRVDWSLFEGMNVKGRRHGYGGGGGGGRGGGGRGGGGGNYHRHQHHHHHRDRDNGNRHGGGGHYRKERYGGGGGGGGGGDRDRERRSSWQHEDERRHRGGGGGGGGRRREEEREGEREEGREGNRHKRQRRGREDEGEEGGSRERREERAKEGEGEKEGEGGKEE